MGVCKVRGIIAFALLFFYFLPSSRADHLMGGDLTYKNLGNNKVAVEFMVYRDCNAASSAAKMPDSVIYYIYAGVDVAKKNYNSYTKRTAKRTLFKKVDPEIPNCKAPTGVCVEQGIFHDTIILGSDSLGYHLSFYSVRRNNAIDNINTACGFSPQPFGMIWYTFIPRKSIANSSPQFLTKPIPYLCVGKKNIFNPLVSDGDKDSLVFSIETPYSPSGNLGCTPPIVIFPQAYPPGHSSFTKLNYKSGYSVTNPFGGTSSISINSVTGEITATPNTAGNYVIAVQVKEYRVNPVTKKSEYVGEIRRDLQFVVGSCPSNFAPQYVKDTIGLTRYVDPGGKICFTVEGNDPSDTLYLIGSSGIFKGPNSTIQPPYATFQGDTAKGKVKAEFCWSPTCDQITYTSPYIVTFNLADNNCNQVFRTYSIYVRTRSILSPPMIHCVDVIDESSIKLTLSDSLSKDSVKSTHFKQYKIYRRPQGGSWSLVDSISSYKTTAWTDKKVTNTSTIFYNYYITSQNTCLLEGLPSDTVTSLVVTGQLLNDRTAKFTWPKQRTKSVKYKIYADDGSGFSLIDSTTALTRTYYSCNKTRRIKVQVADTNCTSNSMPSPKMVMKDVSGPNSKSDVDIKAFNRDNPKKLNYGYSIQVPHTDSIDAKEVYVQRSVNGGTFVSIDTVAPPAVSKTTIVYDSIGTDINKNRYVYRFVFADTCGNSATSKEYALPYVKGKAGQMQNTISWLPAKGFTPASITVTRYYKKPDFTGAGSKSWSLSATDTQFVDTGLTCGHSYFYEVAGATGTAKGTVSNIIELIPFDSVKPAKLKIHYVTVPDNKSAYVTWMKTKDKDVKAYILNRYTVGSAAVFKDTIWGDTTYTDIGINTAQNTYYYQVQGMDSCSLNLGPLSDKFSTVFLSVSRTGCIQKLKLDWTFVNPWPEGVLAYYVYRKKQGGAETLLATLYGAATTYTDASVSNKTRYTYRIEAVKFNGSMKVSSNTSDTIPFRPEAPVITSASKLTTSTTNGTIQVSWLSQKNSPHIKYHELYYRAPGAASFTLLSGNISPAINTYTHTGLNTKTKDHRYLLLSFDSCGNLADSTPIHKTMDVQMQVGQLIHNLQWTPYTGWPVQWYEMQNLQGGNWIAVDSAKGTDTAFTRFPAPCNQHVFYRIRAISAKGYSAISDTAGGQAIDSIPANAPVFQNASVIDNGKIQLDFRGADSADVYGYAILRSDDGGGWKSVDFVKYTTAGAAHTSINLTNTQDYAHCYIISTLDSCLNATNSQPFCAVQLKGTAMNQAEKLRWHPFKGYTVQEYQLQKLNGATWSTIKTFQPTDTTTSFDPQPCYVENIYRVRAIEKTGPRVSLSDTLHITPFDTIVPPAPVLHYVTADPGKGFRLSWSWNKKSDVKYFNIYRVDPGSASPTHIATVKYDSTYLDASVTDLNQAFIYYVTATDSCNTTHISPDSDPDATIALSATTLDCVPLVRLKWTAYTDLEKGTDGYAIFRSLGTGAPTLVASVGAGTLSYTDSTVTDSLDYYYYVVAGDIQSGYSARSDSIHIMPAVYTDPNPVIMLYATVVKTGVTDGEIKLSWTPLDPGDIYARGYHIYMADKPSGPFILVHDETDKTVSTFTHTGINTSGAEHYYAITSYTICDREAKLSAVHHVLNLDVNNKNLEALLTWNAYSGFSVDHYEIRKSVNGSVPAAYRMMKAGDTSYSDTNVYCGFQYTYSIRAVSKDSTEVNSDIVAITAKDNTAPKQADILAASVTATDAANGQITLDFTGAADKNRKGYLLLRSVSGGTYKLLDTLTYMGTGQLQYLDNNLDTRNSTHAYAIRSFDSCGNIALPADTHAAVLLKVAPFNGYNQTSWTPYKGFKTWNYRLERRFGTGPWMTIATTTANQFNDTNIQCDFLYEYRVTSLDLSSGFSAFSNTDTATAFESNPPLVPDMERATVLVTDSMAGMINVSWAPSASSDVKNYHIYRRSGTGTWSLVQTLSSGLPPTYTDVNLNTYRKTYDYKILAEDNCGNISLDNSEIHRAVNLKAVPGNESIDLNWTAYLGFTVSGYEIYRDNNLIYTAAPNTLSFTDTNLFCTDTYSYVIKTISTDTVISESNKDSQRPYDIRPPKPIYLVTATVSKPNDSVFIQWTKSSSFDAAGYKIYRRNMGAGGMKLVHQTTDPNDTAYTDRFPLSMDPTCYFVTVTDACQNSSSSSNAGCVILVSGKAGSLENTISWTPYTYWKSDVQSYRVYRRDSTAWTLLQTVNGSTFMYTDRELSDDADEFCYQVEAIENPGMFNATSRSTVYCLAQAPIVWIPNAFTPDANNLNELFGPKGNYIRNYDMQVFNRWGQLVYQTNEGKPWDARSLNGKFEPMGVYLYRITVYGFDGTRKYFSGTMTVVR